MESPFLFYTSHARLYNGAVVLPYTQYTRIKEERHGKMASTTSGRKRRKTTSTRASYVNVNRQKKGYKDKYKKDVEAAIQKFKAGIGKSSEDQLSSSEWKRFFKTVLIPLDGESERKMISLFSDDRDELNQLLVLHNTRASDNLAEVYYKKYEKSSPTKWYDLEDFKQMALEGLSIAAQRYKIDSGNRFITYATWWMLNKVRKPYQEKGALVGHSSLEAAVSSDPDGNTSKLEEVLSPDMIANGWKCSTMDENVNPTAVIDSQNVEENVDLYSALKHIKQSQCESLDMERAEAMMDYLTSIVDRNSNSYRDKQIFLYLFRKVFHKCSTIIPSKSTKLCPYIEEAAKSKAELLSRLNMDEKQYESTCQRLIRGNYNGL